MFGRFRLVSGALVPFALLTLPIFIFLPAPAAANVWHSTVGQTWFYEIRSSSGQDLAGTWWESSLTPGNTYTIKFNVKSLKGKMSLYVGNNPAITISQGGTYSYDFNISESGKRRMVFQSAASNVVADVNNISVTPKWTSTSTAQSTSISSNSMPRGHYVAYDRTRNLQQELADANRSGYHKNVAAQIHQALTTPGVKGFWMRFNWKALEVGDGKFNWSVIDANMSVARKYGKKYIVAISDRSFDGTSMMPSYFPGQYVLWDKRGSFSNRWDPWVYNRLIRLHKAIANRYSGDSAFGGIANSETALDSVSGDYTLAKYRTALTQVVNQTQAALRNGKYFFYMNFVRGGDSNDMNRDARISLLRDVPHGRLALGGPDITPDRPGMPRSATAYRIHARKKMPGLSQFCHLQHADQGQNHINVKSNKARIAYFNEVETIRNREKQYWFKGTPAVFEFDDLRDPNGNKVKLHPNHVLGKLWRPDEVFQFARRNFNCAYVVWHYREHPPGDEFSWEDVRPVILNNQYF